MASVLASSSAALRGRTQTLEVGEKGWKIRKFSDMLKGKNAANGPKLKSIVEEEKITLRQKVFRLFDEPLSSKPALVIAVWILFLIVFGTVTFCLESLPRSRATHWDGWFVLETIAIMNFTVEYLARFIAAEKRWEFVKGPMNLIDLIAIIPYYLELVLASSGVDVSGLAVIRIIRLTRVFRLFKLSKYSVGFKLVSRTMVNSVSALSLMTFLISLAMVFFASGLWFAEQGHSELIELDGEYVWVYTGKYCSGLPEECASPFQSIPITFWWAVVTLTTVGYGDMYPITPIGQVLGAITMLSGILIIAFPITIVGMNFGDQWTAYKEKEEKRREERQIRLAASGKPPTKREARRRHERLIVGSEETSARIGAFRESIDVLRGKHLAVATVLSELKSRIGEDGKLVLRVDPAQEEGEEEEETESHIGEDKKDKIVQSVLVGAMVGAGVVSQDL